MSEQINTIDEEITFLTIDKTMLPELRKQRPTLPKGFSVEDHLNDLLIKRHRP